MSEKTAESEAQRVRDMTSGPVLHPLAEPKTVYKAPSSLAIPADAAAVVILGILTFSLEGSGLMFLWVPAIHALCIGLGKQDPHIGNILHARFSLWYSLLFVGKTRSKAKVQRADGAWTKVKSRVFHNG